MILEAGSTKRYYVYENWRARGHKAIVHKGNCAFCIDVTGLSRPGTRPDRGTWHGPYDTKVEADNVASSLGAEFVSSHLCCY